MELHVSFDLVIRACQHDMIRHFGSCYCNNNMYMYMYTLWITSKYVLHVKMYVYSIPYMCHSSFLASSLLNSIADFLENIPMVLQPVWATWRSIDWLIVSCFYSISAIFRSYNGGLTINDESEDVRILAKWIWTAITTVRQLLQ